MKIYLALVLATLGLSLASAESRQAEATANILFKGSSTLHGFEGIVSTQPFTATFDNDTADGPMRITATAFFNVLDMDTDHKKRDKKMRKMLDQPQFSTISATLSNAVLPTTGTATVPLNVKIRNVEHPVTATLSDWKVEGEFASCRMMFPISLKAFKLKAPSVIGLIRVGDTVEVECTVQARLNALPKGK